MIEIEIAENLRAQIKHIEKPGDSNGAQSKVVITFSDADGNLLTDGQVGIRLSRNSSSGKTIASPFVEMKDGPVELIAELEDRTNFDDMAIWTAVRQSDDNRRVQTDITRIRCEKNQVTLHITDMPYCDTVYPTDVLIEKGDEVDNL